MFTKIVKALPYAGKVLDFLHLLEDGGSRLSLTGLQMWATSILNFHTQLVSHDHILQGMAITTNASAMVAHAYKRSQTIGTTEGDPPWKGEAD